MKEVQRIINDKGEVTALVLPLDEQDQIKVGALERFLEENLKRHRTRKTITLNKQDVIELLANHEDTLSVDELSYELYFRAHIREGLRDLEAGRTYSTEEVISRLGLK